MKPSGARDREIGQKALSLNWISSREQLWGYRDATSWSSAKLQYLRRFLEGGCSSCDAAAEALQRLKRRSGDNERIEYDYWSKASTTPRITSSYDVLGLRKLYHQGHFKLQSLWALGVRHESFSSMLCGVLFRSLGCNVVIAYQRSSSDLNQKAISVVVQQGSDQ